jgi:23S rRNA maturation-related 3'-5' exoribonuclease YhaM
MWPGSSVSGFYFAHPEPVLQFGKDRSRPGGGLREAQGDERGRSGALARAQSEWAHTYERTWLNYELTGVILHDIGKVRELSWEIGFEYTVEGTLLGHIQMGVALAEKTMDSLPNFPPKLKTLVLHMILSHHGKLEFGSPKLPMIPEALVLNFLDDLDAKMQAVQGEFEKCIREGKGPDELTGKVWALDQRQLLNTKRWLGEDKE